MPEEIKQEQPAQQQKEAPQQVEKTNTPPGVKVLGTPIKLGPVPDNVKKMTLKIDPEIENDFQAKEVKVTQVDPDKGKQRQEEKKEEKQEIAPEPGEKKEEVQQKEEKKEEKKEPLVKLDNLIKPTKPNKQRDYSAIPEAHREWAKQMSNEAYEAYTGLLKEKADLETKYKESANSSYLQNPNAYILDPQYQNHNQEAFIAKSEGDLWKKALLNIEKGEDFQFPVEIDLQSGNWRLSNPVKPTTELKLEVQQALQTCMQKASQAEGQMQALQANYGNMVKQVEQSNHQTRANLFSWVNDAKELETKIRVGDGEQSIKQIRDNIMSKIHPATSPAQLREFVGDLWAAYHYALNVSQEAQKEAQISEIKRKEVERAEPNSKNGKTEENNGKTNKFGGPSKFSVAGMPI